MQINTQAAQAALDSAAQHLAAAAVAAGAAVRAIVGGDCGAFTAQRMQCAAHLAQAAACVWSADTHTGCAHAGSCMRCWRHEEISALHTACTDSDSFRTQSALIAQTTGNAIDLCAAVQALCDDYTQELRKGFLL